MVLELLINCSPLEKVVLISCDYRIPGDFVVGVEINSGIVYLYFLYLSLYCWYCLIIVFLIILLGECITSILIYTWELRRLLEVLTFWNLRLRFFWNVFKPELEHSLVEEGMVTLICKGVNEVLAFAHCSDYLFIAVVKVI